MSRTLAIILAVLIAVAVLVLGNSLYIVRETQQALVFQFGEVVTAETDTGLHWKLPFVQNVRYYETRLLGLNPKAAEVPLAVGERNFSGDGATGEDGAIPGTPDEADAAPEADDEDRAGAEGTDTPPSAADSAARRAARIAEEAAAAQEERIQNLLERTDTEGTEPVETIVGERLVVDAFALFRITDPVMFFKAAASMENARRRLEPIVNAAIREVLGQSSLETILSEKRVAQMKEITRIVNSEARDFGIEVADVRIRRADLPEANQKAVFARMISERQFEVERLRAQGRAQATQIRSEAEKQRVIQLAEARAESERIRGSGDAEATGIFGDAFGANPDFYAFYRSLESYRKSLGSDSTTYLLAPDSAFFRFFRDMNGGDGAGERR